MVRSAASTRDGVKKLKIAMLASKIPIGWYDMLIERSPRAIAATDLVNPHPGH
jgi:hypothetical protein